MRAVTEAQMDGYYQRLEVSCCLCVTTLEECAIRMSQPYRSYTLHVASLLWPMAVMTIRHMGATAPDHPFAPHVNLKLDELLHPNEWYIQGDGVRTGFDSFGSEGI